MDLDFPPSPPPVEDILAARRAKRLAILAKYSSVGDGTPGQSQSPSSAVQPPLPSSSLSDPIMPAPSASTSAGIATDGTAVPVPDSSDKRDRLALNGVIGQCSSRIRV
jgi:hypothetical protein